MATETRLVKFWNTICNVCWKIEISTTNPKTFWCFPMGQEEAMEEELSILFPRNHSQTRGILKIPKSSNMRNVSKYVSHKNLRPQLLKRSPIHRGVEKPQKPTNLQPHLCAFGQIHKKMYIFATRARAVAVSQRKSSFFLALSRCSQRLERDYTKI